MEIREEIAQQVEDAIRPLIEKPGDLNALGTLELVLKEIRGK